MEAFLKVGVITQTHGIAGEVKVFPTTDDPKRFKQLKTVYTDPETGGGKLHITQVKFFKQMVILRFAECDTIEKVQPYLKKELYVDRAHALPLAEDEYYIADLIGIRVMDEDGEKIGTLTDVITTGANDVYVVSRPQGKELLIPAIKDCIRSVDLLSGCMSVHLLPGLTDL